MSDKKLDMSVLPDGFLIELIYPKKNCVDVVKKFKSESANYIDGGWIMRPVVDHWHFNDGSMVLPDGLVCMVKFADGGESTYHSEKLFLEHNYFGHFEKDDSLSDISIIEVKILGVTSDYELDGKRLGMEVIEL